MTQLSFERQRRGLTQRELSVRLQVGTHSYRKIERGVLIPGPNSGTARKLEQYFGRKLARLLAHV